MNVLISGASIAGPALAYWLKRHGIRPTIVERAPAPRAGGQAIDVRGVALDVLRGMGLLEAVRARRTEIAGMSVVDAEGKEMFRTEERSFSGGRFDSGDVEILRDDLVDLLRDATSDVECTFDDSIVRIDERSDGVEVAFARSGTRRFDLVIGADGLGSGVRQLVFGDRPGVVESLGVGLAVFTAPNELGLRRWQVAHRGDESGYLVYTARNDTELRVTLGFALTGLAEERGPVEAQKRLVAERCAHLGGAIPRLLSAMWSAPDFYFGPVAKVHLPTWSRGRVALTGDAAYCPSPFSGQGTSLALVGAYVLSEELARTPRDHAAAFARYEARLRPYVEKNQALARIDQREPIGDEELDAAKNAIRLEIA